MSKTVLFAFKGNPICFVHVLLNALDIEEKGNTCKIVLEGEAVALVDNLRKPENPLHTLYTKVKDKGLIDGVCRACAVKLEAIQAIEEEGLPLVADMAGHIGMASYIEQGYAVVAL